MHMKKIEIKLSLNIIVLTLKICIINTTICNNTSTIKFSMYHIKFSILCIHKDINYVLILEYDWSKRWTEKRGSTPLPFVTRVYKRRFFHQIVNRVFALIKAKWSSSGIF